MFRTYTERRKKAYQFEKILSGEVLKFLRGGTFFRMAFLVPLLEGPSPNTIIGEKNIRALVTSPSVHLEGGLMCDAAQGRTNTIIARIRRCKMKTTIVITADACIGGPVEGILAKRR